MYYTSPGYQAALARGGGVLRITADLYQDDTLIYPGLPILDGEVEVDGTSDIHRTLNDLVVVDPDGALMPARSGDALTPYGNEIRVYRGLSAASVGGTADEMVPLGVFRLSDTQIEDRPDEVAVVLQAYDRSRSISRRSLTDIYLIGKGANYATAIADGLDYLLPGVTGDRSTFASTSEVTPLIIFQPGDDPWAQFKRMASAIGMDLYFNRIGVPVLSPVVDPATAPVEARYVEGESARPLLGLRRGFSDEPGYNGVIVLGESTSISAPVRGEAWDNNPDSPTYYLGRYGRVPKVEYSELAVTQAAVNAQATASLRRNLGGTELLDYSIVPDAAHEAWDVTQVTRAQSKIDMLALFQAFSVPLNVAGEMPVTTKQRRSAE